VGIEKHSSACAVWTTDTCFGKCLYV